MTDQAPDDSLHKNVESLMGSWTMLFPATYVVHIAEEYWGGFVEFTAKLTGLVVSESAFLAGNAALLLGMCGMLLWASLRPSRDPLVAVLGTIVVVNASLHIGGSFISASYSPGLISGLLLWLPLGIAALVRSRRILPAPRFRFGVLMGLLAHTLVPVLGLGFALVF